MAKLKIGTVGYVNMGEWNSETIYNKLKVVTYEGSSYASLIDNNIGNVPTDKNYWQLMASKGDKGDKPINGQDYNTDEDKETIKNIIVENAKPDIDEYVTEQKKVLEDKEKEIVSELENEKSILIDEIVDSQSGFDNNAKTKTAKFNENVEFQTKVASNIIDEKISRITEENIDIDPNAEIIDARSGFPTLGSIIKQKIYHFNNVEEMKNCLTLIPGDVVETLGYYEENDGGGATYRIRTKTENDVEDNSTLLKLQNSLVADLIVNGERITMCQLGYMPNIITQDCHDVIDKYNAICKRDNRKYELFFPAGHWYFSETDIYYYSDVRRGVIFTGVSSQVSTDVRTGESAIMPFRDNQEYIWNIGKSSTSTSIVGGNMIKNFTFTCGGGGENPQFKKGFCKIGLLLTYCCYSDFDGLYFSYFRGTGLCIQTGFENRFGYLNIRCVGYTTKEYTYPGIWIKKHPIRNVPSAVSAMYIDYINFESFDGNGIMIDAGSNCVHCEINNIQCEWSWANLGGKDVKIEDVSDTLLAWDDMSENIEHRYLIKGSFGTDYNPLCINTISVSTATPKTRKITYTDDDGTEQIRYIRTSGILGVTEYYEENRYGLNALIGKISVISSMPNITVPIFHATNLANYKGTEVRVGVAHGYEKCSAFLTRGNTFISTFYISRNKFKNNTLINKRIYFADNPSQSALGSIGDTEGINGLIWRTSDTNNSKWKFSLDGSKKHYILTYVDYDTTDDMPDSIKFNGSMTYSDSSINNREIMAMKKDDFINGKYPLKEWFLYPLYETYAEKIPAGLVEYSITNANSRVYFSYVESTKEIRNIPASYLSNSYFTKSDIGSMIYCSDRRENENDELGLMMIFDGREWKSLKGTKVENLVS